MKTTIYELLGMIKEGKAPKKILFNDEEWEWYKFDYKNKNSWDLFDEYVITDILNNEVIILETTITYNANQLCGGGSEKIEKLHTINNIIGATDLAALRSMQWENNQKFFRKINEIIEALDER